MVVVILDQESGLLLYCTKFMVRLTCTKTTNRSSNTCFGGHEYKIVRGITWNDFRHIINLDDTAYIIQMAKCGVPSGI